MVRRGEYQTRRRDHMGTPGAKVERRSTIILKTNLMTEFAVPPNRDNSVKLPTNLVVE
jgi:hypothetical protein